jgi:signal transduction histidine kinase
MRPLGSLRSRVFAATALVAVLPIAAALLFVTRGVTRQAEADLRRGLVEASQLVEQYHRTRLDLAAERAALVADLPRLKAAVAESDPRTVEPVARDYRERVRSDVFIVADRAGGPLVSIGVRGGGWPPGEAGFRVDGGRLLETVEVPIVIGAEAPELLGRLTLGFALDSSFVGRLRRLTGSEIAVVRGDRVFASTLPRWQDGALVLRASRAGGGWLELAGEEYGTARATLGAGPEAPVVLVLRSRAEALRPLRTLRAAVAAAAFGAIAVSLLLSWAVARTVTRPLAALTDEMKLIAATGDLGRRIAPPQPWDDEDAKLLSRTFGSLTASIVRFQQQVALRDRLSALGRLSTVIAHEVRNPLMIITGSLRTLKKGGASEAEVREAAADIEQEVARLNRVVGDVLDFARPLRLEPSRVDVIGVVRDAARAAFEGRDGQGARLALDPETGSVVTDPERLRAVLVNLIDNARDGVAAREPDAAGDAPEGVVVGSRRNPGGGVRIWVEDRGVGIPQADLAHVFEPYFTSKRTGTGLGLAIVRKVTDALGGTVRIESREGSGTRVEIDLPAELPPAPEEAR